MQVRRFSKSVAPHSLLLPSATSPTPMGCCLLRAGRARKEKEAMAYLERRECEYDKKTLVDFFKDEDSEMPFISGVIVLNFTGKTHTPRHSCETPKNCRGPFILRWFPDFPPRFLRLLLGTWLYYQFIPEGKEYPVFCRKLAGERKGWLNTLISSSEGGLGGSMFWLTGMRLQKSMFIIGDGNNMYDFTYVENVAHAHVCVERALASEESVSEKAAGQVHFL